MSENFTSFSSSEENSKKLKAQRIKNGEKVIFLGIPFLDAAFRGVTRTDVVLLGAGSGAGKSEVVFHIAFYNASIGKKVLVLSLEAEDLEVEQRQMYKIFARKYFDDAFKVQDVYMNYTDFYFGRLEHIYEKYEKETLAEFEKFKTNYTRYTRKSYTLSDFALDVENASDADLIILDHLHYIDLNNDNENKAFKEALMKIRNTVLKHEIPVILVSQLRKDSASSSPYTSVMPDISDFHGSSDIFKIATKGIMFASGVGVVDSSDTAYRRPTLVKAVKNRIDGSVKIYTGCMAYNFKTNSYEDDFLVGSLVWEKDPLTNQRVEKFKIETDLPRWAKKTEIK